jgi:hypothetical protein
MNKILLGTLAAVGLGIAVVARKDDEAPDIPDLPPPPEPPLPGAGVDDVPLRVEGESAMVIRGIAITPPKKGQAMFPVPGKVPNRAEKPKLAPYICENDLLEQKAQANISVGTKLHATWQPFFGWCLTHLGAGNKFGLLPGYYVALWKHNKTRRYVFGPFSHVAPVPGGRPEVDAQSAIRDLLQHGKAYARAREVK